MALVRDEHSFMEWLPVDIVVEITLRCPISVASAQLAAAGVPLHTAAFGDRVARATNGLAMSHHLKAIAGSFPWHVCWFCLTRHADGASKDLGLSSIPTWTLIECAKYDPSTVATFNALGCGRVVTPDALVRAARTKHADDFVRFVMSAIHGPVPVAWWDAIKAIVHASIVPRTVAWRALRALALYGSGGPTESVVSQWEAWDKSIGTLARMAHAPADTSDVVDGVPTSQAWRAFCYEKPESQEDFDLMLRRLSMENRVAEAEMPAKKCRCAAAGVVTSLLLFPDKQHVVEGSVSEHVEFNELVFELQFPLPLKGHSSLFIVAHNGDIAQLFTGDPEYARDMFRGLSEDDYEAQNFVVLSNDHTDDMALVVLHSRGLDYFHFFVEGCQQSPVALPD